jgi:hypothetical protein
MKRRASLLASLATPGTPEGRARFQAAETGRRGEVIRRAKASGARDRPR